MKLKNPKIEELTVDYLKFLPFNRAISTKHVTNLLNSMTNYGILRIPVILRTSIFGKTSDYIIDAQHMISALSKADHKTVPCIVIEEDDITKIIDTMAVLNNTAAIWKIDDYVNAYCHMPGKEDYKILKIHHLATGFNYTVSSKILNGTTGNIKNGKFKINCSDADMMTQQVVDITSLFNTNSAKFMIAYITFARGIKGYNHKKFMQSAAKHKDSFEIVHDTVLMINGLNKIYK
jgi:hypothetical protein